MGASDNVRSISEFCERLRDVDIRRTALTANMFATEFLYDGSSDFIAYAFAQLVKEISQGDDALETAILRSWGIR